jgi:F0F1-type ATP synthase alpha subunit
MNKNKNSVSVDEVLNMVNNKTKKIISEIEREEKTERVETLDSIVNDIKGHKIQTNREKVKFAQEIKSGLGTKIKDNPNYIIIYKKPWYVKLGNFIKRIFTKF